VFATLLAAGALAAASWSASRVAGAPGAGLAEPLWLTGLIIGVPALLILAISALHRPARPAASAMSAPLVERPKEQEPAHIKVVREALEIARREALRRVRRDDLRHGRRRADE
jgi:hypothetical protein